MSLYDDAAAIYHYDSTWDDAKGVYDIVNDGATFDTVNQIVGSACASLDGTDDAPILDSLLPALSSNTQGGISIWVRPGDSLGGGIFVSFGDANAVEYIIFQQFGSGVGRIRADLNNAGVHEWAVSTDASYLVDDTWINLILNHNGTEPSLHIAGVKEAQTFVVDVDRTQWISNLSGVDNIRLGCLNYNSGGNQFFYEGKIDETVFMPNRPFTAGEIAFLAAGNAVGISDGVNSKAMLLNRRRRIWP
jgi:hypothetical protein